MNHPRFFILCLTCRTACKCSGQAESKIVFSRRTRKVSLEPRYLPVRGRSSTKSMMPSRTHDQNCFGVIQNQVSRQITRADLLLLIYIHLSLPFALAGIPGTGAPGTLIHDQSAKCQRKKIIVYSLRIDSCPDRSCHTWLTAFKGGDPG
jgi:hypothetical protein